MNNLIVACSNLRNEIEMIIKDIDDDINIIYIDSKYHNNPQQLHEKLQHIIDENYDCDKIVFLYGQCGNATIGLQSKYSELIFPKVSDCISLYLGGNERRSNLYKNERSYYFTKTYLENENSMYKELQIMKEKYGDKKAIKMYKMLMKNYEYIRIIKTPAYEVEEIIVKINELCNDLDLKYEIIECDLSILSKAITLNIDDDFVVNNEGEKVLSKDFL